MAVKKALISEAILLPIYAALTLGGYWGFIDTEEPSALHYQHSRFLSREVFSKEQAERAEVTEARTGDKIWRYLEYTLERPVLGQIYRRWICEGAQPVQEAVKSSVGEVGEHKRSISLDVPFVARRIVDCEWQQALEYRLNPLTTVRVDYPPIKLRVLPP